MKKSAWQRYIDKKPSEWKTWRGMLRRCHDNKHISYEFYGARGITVCDRWREHGTGFKNFYADLGSKPSKDYSLGRIDPDKGYCKENCRWELKALNFALSRGCFKSKDEVPF